jgi:FkbM family methyltransferase
MDLIYRIIYNRYINFILRWINKLAAPVLPSGIKIPPSGVIRLNSGNKNIKLATNQTSYLTQRVFWYGPSSFEYTSVFQKLIKKADCFFDIGSNIGYYTLLACAENSDIFVYSFEPAHGAYVYLKRNISLNNLDSQVKIEKIALTDVSTTLTFHEVKNDKYRFTRHVLSGESNASTKPLDREFETYQVKGITLDEYCHKNDISSVDIMKIDTEGSEFDILNGGKKFISSKKPIIICEILFDFKEDKIESIMSDFGYEFYLFKGNKLVKTDTLLRAEDDGVRDCFFVPPEKKSWIDEFIQKSD